MKNKRNILIILLSMILICCAGTVCAADSNNTVDIVSDVDSNEEYISVSDNEQADNVDESVLSSQSKNSNWSVNVGKLSADSDLLSDDFDDDNFDDDDDPDDGEYNNYVDNNDYSVVDKNKVYFYNRIHSGDSLYFEFLTHLVDKSGFTLDLTNSDVNNQIYKLIATKDYSFKLYDGKQYNVKKGESYTAAFNNRYDYNIYGSTFKDVVYVKDNVNYLDEDYLSWLHWNKKIGNTIPSDNLNNIIITDTIVDSNDLPGYYNLIDEGLVSSFKKQIGDDCWAFSAIAALESHLMKTDMRDYVFLEDFDFSENHLRNVMSSRGEHGTNFNKMGNIFMSSSYFARWSGPILESDDIYDKNRKNNSYESFYPVKHVQDMLFIPARNNATVDKLIKKAIMDYGAVVTSMRITNFDYTIAIVDKKPVLTFNINPNNDYGNHSVAIIGWDDNFDKTNFLNQPIGDGAFIIKDSNFDVPVYVSYYDPYFANTSFSMAFVNVEDSNNYKSIYQNDYVQRGDTASFNSNDVTIVNKFVANDDEMIAAVGFYNLQESECIVEVWVNNEKKYNSSKTSFSPGYHTVKLDNQTPIKIGDAIDISIRLISNHNIEVIRDIYSPGNSYYYSNGNQVPYNDIFGIKFYTAFDSNVRMSYIESKDITKDYDNNLITMGLLKDKNGNFIVNGVGKINELDNTYRVKKVYNFKSTNNGEIILSDVLNPNDYDFIIAFDGSKEFIGCSKHVSVKVNKLTTQIVNNNACTVEDTLKFTLKHGDSVLANRALDVYVNGEYRHLITNINGEVEIVLYNAGFHSIKVNFNGDVIYKHLSYDYSLDVQKKILGIELKNMKITYRNGEKINVKVDKPNVKVMLTIGKKTYTRISDATGLVSFNVGKKPGDYTATFSIEDPRYNGTNSHTLNIKKLKLDSMYDPGRSLKKQDLTLILLKEGTKNKMGGITVKYQFKTKDTKYNANYKKTNDDGKIKFKTKSLNAGTYTFTYRVSDTKYNLGSKGKVSTTIKIK